MKRALGDSVFDRRGAGNLSERAYIALISFFTLYGLAVTGFLAVFTAHLWGPINTPTKDRVAVEASANPGGSTTTPQPEATQVENPKKAENPDEKEKSMLAPTNSPTLGMGAFLLLGFVIPLLGIFIALGSDKPIISFLGYNMVVVGFGMILGPTIFMYSADIVLMALATTFLLTLGMSAIGIAYPKSLAHWGGWLFGILLAVIVGQFTGIFMSMIGYPGVAQVMDSPVMHILISILFCAYIIYDWNRALRIPKTVDNAIDTAVALYLDIINLFIHILSLYGKSQNSS